MTDVKKHLSDILPGMAASDIDDLASCLAEFLTPLGVFILPTNTIQFVMKQLMEQNIPPINTILLPVVAETNMHNSRMQSEYGEYLVEILKFNKSCRDPELRQRIIH